MRLRWKNVGAFNYAGFLLSCCLGRYLCHRLVSLHHRHHITVVSNICKAALTSLLWAPDRLNKLLEVYFEFPVILIGKSTIAFLTSQS